MAKVIAVLLLIVGLINFAPVAGVISGARLAQAYNIELLGNDLVILMRHRALLFGIIGGFLLFSVYSPAYRPAAMVMAAISMLGFLLIVWQEGGYNAALRKVLWMDVLGIVCLGLAAVLHWWKSPV